MAELASSSSSSIRLPSVPVTLPPPSSAAEEADDDDDNVEDHPYGALKILMDSQSSTEQQAAAVEPKIDEAEETHTTEHIADDEAAAVTEAIAAAAAAEDEEEIRHDDHTEEAHAVDEETTSVEHRLKKISEEIEKYSSSDAENDSGRQSFFSLSDLIKTLRPSDKKVIPQIDSDYSNTMRVLGETSSIVSGVEARKLKSTGVELKLSNRSL